MGRIRQVSVVLGGDENDKETFQTAVRLAAREHARVRAVLGPACGREMYEKHLDFVLWDVQTRLGLVPPEITLECALDGVSLQVVAAPERALASRGEA